MYQFVLSALILLLAAGQASAGSLYLAAGGGGGSAFNGGGDSEGQQGQITTWGSSGVGIFGGQDGGAGGVAGAGGAGADGGGGAGWLGNGGNGLGGLGGFGPPTFAGGVGYDVPPEFPPHIPSIPANGGYGGGGGAGFGGGGGGGGYSGGGGENGPVGFGGGGGSCISPDFSSVIAEAGGNAGNGFVEIGATMFGFTGGPIYFTAPATGTYAITAAGAEGGFYGGLGAEVGGNIFLDAGTRLELIVGGMGFESTVSGDNSGGGGGGGTFVFSVPESSTWAMMLIAFAGLGIAGRRNPGSGRRKRSPKTGLPSTGRTAASA